MGPNGPLHNWPLDNSPGRVSQQTPHKSSMPILVHKLRENIVEAFSKVIYQLIRRNHMQGRNDKVY